MNIESLVINTAIAVEYAQDIPAKFVTGIYILNSTVTGKEYMKCLRG
jgi:hypothetical protein